MIPHYCPLLVQREDPNFVVTVLDTSHRFSHRHFLVVASYIMGFVHAWAHEAERLNRN
jgi:hypothetical protein